MVNGEIPHIFDEGTDDINGDDRCGDDRCGDDRCGDDTDGDDRCERECTDDTDDTEGDDRCDGERMSQSLVCRMTLGFCSFTSSICWSSCWSEGCSYKLLVIKY